MSCGAPGAGVLVRGCAGEGEIFEVRAERIGEIGIASIVARVRGFGAIEVAPPNYPAGLSIGHLGR